MINLCVGLITNLYVKRQMNTGLAVEMSPQTRKFSRPSLSIHIIEIHIIKNIQIKRILHLIDDKKKSNLYSNNQIEMGRFCIVSFWYWAFLVLGRLGSGAF